MKKYSWYTVSLSFVVFGAAGIYCAEVFHILEIDKAPNIVGAGVAISLRAFILVGAIQVKGRGRIGEGLAYTSTVVMFLLSAFYIWFMFGHNQAVHVVMQTGNVSLMFIELFAGVLSQESPYLVMYRNRRDAIMQRVSQLRDKITELSDMLQESRDTLSRARHKLSQAEAKALQFDAEKANYESDREKLLQKISILEGSEPDHMFLIEVGKRTVFFDLGKLVKKQVDGGIEITNSKEQMLKRLDKKSIDYSKAIML